MFYLTLLQKKLLSKKQILDQLIGGLLILSYKTTGCVKQIDWAVAISDQNALQSKGFQHIYLEK